MACTLPAAISRNEASPEAVTRRTGCVGTCRSGMGGSRPFPGAASPAAIRSRIGDGAADHQVVGAEARGLGRGGHAALVAGVVARQADARGEHAQRVARAGADRGDVIYGMARTAAPGSGSGQEPADHAGRAQHRASPAGIGLGLDAIFLAGPGHGAPGVLAPVYLEGTYAEIYPNKGEDLEGMRQFFKDFSFPGGIPSHVAAEVPGSIHEGGELGYSLSHAFGAALVAMLGPAILAALLVRRHPRTPTRTPRNRAGTEG